MTRYAPPTLVILAAGMSSRYGKMKQTSPVGPGDHALVEYTLYDAWVSGWRDFLFVVRKEIEEPLREFFSSRLPHEARIRFAIQRLDDIPPGNVVPSQRMKPWGTAHAILAARDMISSPFATINCDDYYGRQILTDMHHHLQQTPTTSSNYFLAGYRLDKTLSTHGTVSRAICVTEQDMLQHIEEHQNLTRREENIVSLDRKQEIRAQFTGEETVSMNLFGLTPQFFPDTWKLFAQFITDADETQEFYLPYVLNTLIAQKKASVRVIPASEQWYGLTHPADQEVVQSELEKKVKEKIYPLRLWK